MLIFLSVLMVVLITISVLPMFRIGHWSVRIFDFPRMQIAVITCVAFIISVFVDDKPWWFIVLMCMTLATLIYQMRWIITYTPIYKKEVAKVSSPDPLRTLSIISSNVLTPNRQAHLLLAHIKKYDPDIVLTLESDQWWQAQLSPLEKDYPYRLQKPLDNLYGMHLYSKLPLTDAEIRYQVMEDIPSMVAYATLRNGDRVRLYCLHPMPPSPTENPRAEERDAELIVVGEEVKKRQEPALVFGDLNDVAWSKSTLLFRRISEMLDPRIGRQPFSTFHAKIPFLRWPLDHIFHTTHFNLVEMNTLAGIGSDHLPIYVKLEFCQQADSTIKPNEMSDEDKQHAQETKEEVNFANQTMKVNVD